MHMGINETSIPGFRIIYGILRTEHRKSVQYFHFQRFVIIKVPPYEKRSNRKTRIVIIYCGICHCPAVKLQCNAGHLFKTRSHDVGYGRSSEKQSLLFKT